MPEEDAGHRKALHEPVKYLKNLVSKFKDQSVIDSIQKKMSWKPGISLLD